MRILFTFISLISVIMTYAQTTQTGIVQEYNERSKKTPLAGVELNVRSAGNTVSGKNGEFSLQFLTLKPGEKVNVRRIEKLGYEIFNKEAVEQWNINPKTPFIIIMCKSDRFKRIRDNYEKVSSESYARQLKKEEAALAKLKEEGKLKEIEYEQKLIALHENYDKQLDNIENYVDRFSRIDLSEISSVEQEIIGLVQDGRIEEAITKYEEQNYVTKYTREVAQLKQISSAIDQLSDIKSAKEQSRDSLYSAVDRQIETLRLAGGKDNFNKIGIILQDIYNADTTYVASIEKFAEYLYETKQFSKSYPLYLKLTECININANKLLLYYNRLSLIEKDLEHYDNAISFSVKAEKLIKDNSNNFSYDQIMGIALNRGLIYYHQHEINMSKKYLEEAVEYGESHQCSALLLSLAKNSLANIYSRENNEDAAIKMYKDIYSLYLDINDESSESYERISGVLLNISQSYHTLEQYENAMDFIDKSVVYIQKCYDYNPLKYSVQYINILNTAGNIYSDISQYEKAESYYKKAFDLSLDKYQENPYLFWRTHFQPLANIGILFTSKEQYQEAIDTFSQALNIIRNAPESKYRSKVLCETLYNQSYVFCITENYDLAIPLLLESLIYSKDLFSYNKQYGASMYLNSLNNIAYCYDEIGEFEKSKQSYIQALGIIEDLNLESTIPFNSKYADYLYNIGCHIHHKENLFESAIPYYLKAYDIYSQIDSQEDILQSIIGLAECYLKINQIEMALEWINKFQNTEICNSTVGWLHTRGLIAIKSGDTDMANFCKRRISEINPDAHVSTMDLFQ